jgi:hypothetical protein
MFKIRQLPPFSVATGQFIGLFHDTQRGTDTLQFACGGIYGCKRAIHPIPEARQKAS